MNDHQSQRLLDALSEPSRAALLEGFRVRRLVQGEILGGPQEIRDSVFILRSGRIRVFLTFEDKEQTLTFLEPGDIHDGHAPAPGGFTYATLYLEPAWLERALPALFEQAPADCPACRAHSRTTPACCRA